MSAHTSQFDSGMELRDLTSAEDFLLRAKKNRAENRESVALRRLSKVFAERPEIVLQELVDTAVKACGADSAGISLEEPENATFRWIVVAGSFSQYLDGRTPRNYSPCGTCLDSGKPQLYKVTQPYYDHLGVAAEPILDGLLIPWSNEFLRGTLWAVSHKSEDVFDASDYDLLRSLADFTSIILRHQHQQKLIALSEKALTIAEMANGLAHRINNPLQNLTNTIFLARQGSGDVQEHLAQAEVDLKRLSEQVAKLLNTAERLETEKEQSNP